ncbi:cyanase [Aneurinibacillus terranovensis]|uniref:cyanase n=1 Tax=Aneurinibacillus terranovensis TaxID=278991 RepID=UPI00041992A7|nr:cyanase [Aneurinibacillus terranovensis]
MIANNTVEVILKAKQLKGLTFSEIAEAVERSEVWTTAALMGQQTMNAQEAEAVVKLLDLPEEVGTFLQTIPYRGTSVSLPPTDPTIYRFYELILVYGEAIKALIHEKFGDGIMSAIDFKMDMAKKEDPQGARVVITLDGKFLPYKKF